ncbi:hypothetical protein [Enterococcus sp. AZ194]|uniref:hypothetical protein n=1 Tax=Enterococcus sp. AZ194 TaxID=2774629 RepID=UPI003F6872A9
MNYNWFLTDVECNHYPNPILEADSDVWLSGDELLKLVREDDIQFIWGVFSAFSKEITYEEVSGYDLYPDAQIYDGIWRLPLKIQ